MSTESSPGLLLRADNPHNGDIVQTGETFTDHATALRWLEILGKVGPDQARAMLNTLCNTVAAPEITVEQWCETHITKLTGVGPGTPGQYRAYIRNDIKLFMGDMGLSEVTRDTIAEWITYLSGDGELEHNRNASKTIANKHGFLFSVMASAVRAGLIAANPCEGTRLPEGLGTEMVFLTPDEWTVLHDCLMPRWRPLATFLLLSGMRFGEATALTIGDIDSRKGTCRINKAWKYTGSHSKRVLGPPKTKKGKRTISLAPEALEGLRQPAASQHVWMRVCAGRIPFRLPAAHNR
jgi:integrase